MEPPTASSLIAVLNYSLEMGGKGVINKVFNVYMSSWMPHALFEKKNIESILAFGKNIIF